MTETLDQVSLEAQYHPQAYIVLKETVDGQDRYTRYSAAAIEAGRRGNDYNTRILTQLQNNVKRLEDYLVENHENIDESVLSDLQDMFGIVLEKTLKVMVSVDFEMDITVPLHEADDFEVTAYDFDFSVDSYKYHIDDSDYSINDWNVN